MNVEYNDDEADVAELMDLKRRMIEVRARITQRRNLHNIAAHKLTVALRETAPIVLDDEPDDGRPELPDLSFGA